MLFPFLKRRSRTILERRNRPRGTIMVFSMEIMTVVDFEGTVGII